MCAWCRIPPRGQVLHLSHYQAMNNYGVQYINNKQNKTRTKSTLSGTASFPDIKVYAHLCSCMNTYSHV